MVLIKLPHTSMENKLKDYNTIGCCGIDCGLCPRFYTKGDSVCPGCGGPGFREKHPSCSILTCCVIKKGLETCADCAEYPCFRFDPEKDGKDSFVTHKRIFTNLDLIQNKGYDFFLSQQRLRMNYLADFISKCDDGRSKSFYCISCALLPLENLRQSHEYMTSLMEDIDVKKKSKLIKDYLRTMASAQEVDLKLDNKK